MVAFLSIDTLVGAVVGFVAGAFTPGVLRKIKASTSKEATAVKTSVETKAATAVADIAKKL